MAIEYSKKTYKDKNTNKLVSFWSTDDNILCEDKKTLREKLNTIQSEYQQY